MEKIATVMGNKNTNMPKSPDTAMTQREEGASINSLTGGVSRDGPPGPSPELLASLQSLGENNDYTLLPQSLHQIAEAYSLKEDYQWAIQFLELEKLYHERLLSNLTTLQENWEGQWKEKNAESSLPAETDSINQKHMETLNHICRTHLRPSLSVEQNLLTLKGIQRKNETLQFCQDEATRPEMHLHDDQSMSSKPHLPSAHPGHQNRAGVEDGEGEDVVYEEGQEVEEEEDEEPCEETPEEEEVKVEWPTGVPQASDKDLAKLSSTEGNSSPDGLVSILKRRRASLDGLPPPSNSATQQNPKRKVRFSEPDDGIEQDEVGGDSCLILLLLCLVTVVISIGGTALYCTLVDTYSNICTDFTHNADFYITSTRRFFEGLGHWLPFRT